MEGAGRQQVDHAREVTEEDAVGARVDELLRARRSGQVRARIDARDLHAAAPELDRPGVVGEQRGGSEVDKGRRLRERVPADGVVVIAEHRVRARKAHEDAAKALLAARPREQVAADEDEVGPPLGDPVDRPLDRPHTPRGKPEVEVGEVRDAQPVELGRESGQRDPADGEPHPARLVPAPGGHARGRPAEEPGGPPCPPRRHGPLTLPSPTRAHSAATVAGSDPAVARPPGRTEKRAGAPTPPGSGAPVCPSISLDAGRHETLR